MTLQRYLDEDQPHLELLRFLFKDQPPSVILEVGCCEGEDTVRYSKMFPSARIISFEPLPENAEKARRTIERHQLGNVTLIEAAIGDSNGVIDFHVSSGQPPGASHSPDWDYGNKSSSILKPSSLMAKHYPWLRFERSIRVHAHRLDSVLAEHDLDVVDFMHVDVQGAELLLLKGAGSAMRRIRSVWIEVANEAVYVDQPGTDEVERYFSECGFAKVLDTSGGAICGDQFYVNRALFGISLVR